MMLPDPTQPSSSSWNSRVPPSSSDASPNAADHVTELAHELSNLLDGSMRWLALAARALPAHGLENSDTYDQTRQHIDQARVALESMSQVVGAAMKPVPLGSPLHEPGVGISLGEAIDHAIEVSRPRGTAMEIEFDVTIATLAGQSSAGPLYSVILNAILNATESIGRCREPGAQKVCGRIEVEAGVIEEGSKRSLMIEIRDDGKGLPKDSTNGSWPFVLGNSIKPGGTGIGLAIAKRTTEQVGGTITLTQRRERPLNPDRPGARLQIRLPLPSSDSNPIGAEGSD